MKRNRCLIRALSRIWHVGVVVIEKGEVLHGIHKKGQSLKFFTKLSEELDQYLSVTFVLYFRTVVILMFSRRSVEVVYCRESAILLFSSMQVSGS